MITQSPELPIIPAADESHPSVIACRTVLRQQDAEIERLRGALEKIGRRWPCSTADTMSLLAREAVGIGADQQGSQEK